MRDKPHWKSAKQVLFGAATMIAYSLSSPSSASADCTAVVVNAPVTLFGGRETDYYKEGDTIWFVAEYSVDDGQVYLCSWDGDCVSGKDVHLSKVLDVQGDASRMSGAEIKDKSYDTDHSCTLRDLTEVDH